MITRPQIDALIAAFMSKDIEAVMRFFADDAVLIDPHYPQATMRGRVAIERGLTWGLSNLVKPGLVMRKVWIDGDSACLEVDTHHVFKGGLHLRFAQVFVVEMRDDKIIRLQAYVPYAPHGIVGLFSKLSRWAAWLQGKR